MQSIKRLPRSVHSPLRSSIVLFDLPKVVEELIYNSIDAGATKVYVSINIRACYVKVEDDGCGITRDGLVMLGEKYVTSKFGLMDDIESISKSLGFRGEALGSLSDISLVEVRTKARGKPNAYRKILKGPKCLFFGIDDRREVVGTTVIVRELFYNQPVRRRCMQSSPKKVLHSVKKCVLRTALVHPQILFKVTDIESEDVLLCTIPSSSPLPLISDGFGNEVSSSLHEIVYSDKKLMLSGYISGSADAFSTKAFQYLYINSRFVSKCPIHKLVNDLAARFQGSLAQRVEPEFHRGKRLKNHGYPAYMFNLCCPPLSYDLSFEPSKTIIEFKEWGTILIFFEQAIMHCWEQLQAKSLQGKSFAYKNGISMENEVQKEDPLTTDISKTSNMRKKRCNIQLRHCSVSHSPISSPLKIASEDITTSHGRSSKDHKIFSLEPEPSQSDTEFFGFTDCSLQHVINDRADVLDSRCDQMGGINHNPLWWTRNADSLPLENHLIPDLTSEVKEKCDMQEFVWKNRPPNGTRNLKGELISCNMTDPHDILVNAQKVHNPLHNPNPKSLSKPGMKESYPLMENELCNSTPSGFGIKLVHLRKELDSNALDANYHVEGSSSRDIFCPKKFDAATPSFNIIRKCQALRDLDVLSSDSVGPHSCDQTCLFEENNLHNRLEVCETGSICQLPNEECLLYSRHPTFDSTSRDSLEWNLRSLRCIDAGYSTIMEEKDEFFNSLRNSYSEIYPDESWAKNRSDHEYCSSPKKDMHYGHLSDETTFGDVCLLDNLNHETSWLFSDSINVKRTDGYSKFRVHPVHNHDKGVESSLHEQGFRNHVLPQAHKVRSRRSSSAPPFYKGKCKFFTLNCLAKTARKKPDFEFSKASPESINSLDNVSQSNASQKPLNREVSQPQIRQCIDEKRSRQEMKISYSVGSITDEPEHVAAEMTKWRTGILQPTVKDGDFWHNSFEQSEDILDISSGILHLAGSSLVPESIDKDCLQDARVLLQLDRKFIPVMASGTLIIIDQHAADERIRLEELRRKVLSGEGIGITYLDPEQELVCLSDYPFLMQPVLPEMGLQLLQKYREQIQQWGWICSTPSQPSESFTKNMNLFKRRACGVSLVAVPCILGINLTDKDLIEFIEQLVETDGSSTLPPSVLHVLNFKSCRGAIMFGDSLLPSECSLIVEELKATPLCFQCAHGRPTTVPLLNMAALHEQLAWLQVQQEGPRETWHGLSRHKSSIRRAQLRLDSARKFHSR
ncbi:DNA mismatch repair protein MLH3 isoform X2 [Phoenix dactylifera]|uniref:DNA mismatch repair protein MLH3 isoform X2 n=1 Tax=Phoenix dactylifera TaxID=42345 RepID=A0A8B8ZA85_PHODC|nr:DNA mismatch repair protein MLH3 isoform X2 [Phoenix dactylifera]